MEKIFLLLISFIQYTAISHCMLPKHTFKLRAAFPANNFGYIAISPDNQYIAITIMDQSKKETIKIFNIPRKTEEATIPIDLRDFFGGLKVKDYIEGCKFSADSKQLLFYTYNDILYVWDIATQKVVRKHQLRSNLLVFGMKIFDENRWVVKRTSRGLCTPSPDLIDVIYNTSENNIESVAVTSKGTVPAYNSDGSAIAYQSSEKKITMIKIPSARQLGSLEFDTCHRSANISWSTNDKWMAAVGYPIKSDGVNFELDLYLWDTTSKTLRYHKKNVGYLLDFSGDSEILFYQVDHDRKLQAYNIANESITTFENIHTKTIGCQNNLVACAALIKGKKMLAVYEKITKSPS